MRLRSIVSAVVLVAVSVLVTHQVVSQEPQKEGDKPAAPGQMTEEQMQEMMKKWQEFSAPDEHHKLLARSVGAWDTVSKMNMGPAMPPQESKGSCTVKPVLGGRFFMTEFQGEMMGQPFEGIGLDGYDKFRKQFTSVWIDSTNTATIVFTGECTPDGKECTYSGTMDEPLTGERDKKIKSVVKWTDDDHYTFEMHEALPTGEDYVPFTIEYARRK